MARNTGQTLQELRFCVGFSNGQRRNKRAACHGRYFFAATCGLGGGECLALYPSLSVHPQALRGQPEPYESVGYGGPCMKSPCAGCTERVPVGWALGFPENPRAPCHAQWSLYTVQRPAGPGVQALPQSFRIIRVPERSMRMAVIHLLSHAEVQCAQGG